MLRIDSKARNGAPGADGAAPGAVRVAAAQFYSGPDIQANVKLCIRYLEEAAAAGVQLIVLPENANRTRDFTTREAAWEVSEGFDGIFLTGLRAASARLGLYVVAGVDMRTETRPNVLIGQVLVGPTGDLLHVHHKTVFWDYEYTLFTPGTKQLEVVETPIGRLGLLMCADGIVPEVPRVLGLKGAQVFCNSLNSRGPDEMRVHEPLRAIENHVWHVAANTVGGPADAYPWMGGSQVISPVGEVLANAGETKEGMVWADIYPLDADARLLVGIGELAAFRRPDLYGDFLRDVEDLPVAAMYGPVPLGTPPRLVRVAALQTSWYHSTGWTRKRAVAQIRHAADRGVALGVLPELFCFRTGEVTADPAAAADLSTEVLAELRVVAAETGVWIVVNLVEADGGSFHSTAHLIAGDGAVHAAYRKAHLSEAERAWATPGDAFVVADTPVGVIGLMIGNEVWLPEMARILTLRGAEIIAHPVGWDRPEAPHQAATERTEENRTHLVSAARLDSAAGVGSQVTIADRFVPGQPIALMRYPTAVWSRPGFEENVVVDLDLEDAHSKVQGLHLDPIATRQPHLYNVVVVAGQPALT